MSKNWKVIIVISIVLLMLNLLYSYSNSRKYESISTELNNQKAKIEKQADDIEELKTSLGSMSSGSVSDLEDRVDDLEGTTSDLESRIDDLENNQ